MGRKKSNQEIAYSALMQGLEVEIGGNTYAMSEDGSLIYQASIEKAGRVSKLWVNPLGETTMSGFHGLCDKMTEDERCVIVANIVLNQGGLSNGKNHTYTNR